MAKGSTIVPVRIPEPLFKEIDVAIGMANLVSRVEPYSMSAWIRKAIEEKLAHLQRSKRRKRTVADVLKEGGVE